MSDQLDISIKRPLKPTAMSDLSGITTEAQALRFMARSSGLQDKALAVEIGVDNATFSRALSGQARLSDEQIERFMDAAGSEAWLCWWNARRGYDPASMRRIETDVERENRELREQVARMEREHEIEMRAVMRMSGAK